MPIERRVFARCDLCGSVTSVEETPAGTDLPGGWVKMTTLRVNGISVERIICDEDVTVFDRVFTLLSARKDGDILRRIIA